MQEALTAIFGFGVLTVATVALLNVACLRLHDVQEKGKDEAAKQQSGADGSDRVSAGVQTVDRFLYAYVYDSASAFSERDKLRHLPSFLAWTGVGAIVFVQVLYGIAYLTTCPSERECNAVLDVVTWMSITSYVLVLLGVAAVVSNKVYGVLAKVNRD